MKFCFYYRAHVKRSDVWFIVAVLRSFEHVAFDRTLDKKQDIFEFYVPESMESSFLAVMTALKHEGSIYDFYKTTNRLIESTAQL